MIHPYYSKANGNVTAYLYPNDEIELDRLDMQYEIIRMINEGRIFFAPLENPERLLDIGTGSGIWPIEMGNFRLYILYMTNNPNRRILNRHFHSRDIPRCPDYRNRFVSCPARAGTAECSILCRRCLRR